MFQTPSSKVKGISYSLDWLNNMLTNRAVGGSPDLIPGFKKNDAEISLNSMTGANISNCWVPPVQFSFKYNVHTQIRYKVESCCSKYLGCLRSPI